jgi:predicted RNA polymerase sigma factor
MEIQASRLRARVGPSGEPIVLLDQNRAKWDYVLIQRGLAALERAASLGGALGPFALQAAIAACHARARAAEETDWMRIASLYQALAQVTPSPIVELNRAVAVSMAHGPAAGLEIVDGLTSEPTLASYHLLPSVRGDFLFRLGRLAEAKQEFERAASLTQNTRERNLLLERARGPARKRAPSARANRPSRLGLRRPRDDCWSRPPWRTMAWKAAWIVSILLLLNTSGRLYNGLSALRRRTRRCSDRSRWAC